MEKILLVDKPIGWTSFDVVAKIRGAIKASYVRKGIKPTKRQLKVGHAGTLDPFASGLLIILLGDACKQAGDFLKLDKAYRCTAELGKISSTGDTEGELKVISDNVPTKTQIQAALKKFSGEIEQTPPRYSAIKINGKRAYALAREGEEFEVPARKVKICELSLQLYDYPRLIFNCRVSSGTYIRTLGEDIGEAVRTGAYCTNLRRTTIGNYKVEDAITVEEACLAVDG